MPPCGSRTPDGNAESLLTMTARALPTVRLVCAHGQTRSDRTRCLPAPAACGPRTAAGRLDRRHRQHCRFRWPHSAACRCRTDSDSCHHPCSASACGRRWIVSRGDRRRRPVSAAGGRRWLSGISARDSGHCTDDAPRCRHTGGHAGGTRERPADRSCCRARCGKAAAGHAASHDPLAARRWPTWGMAAGRLFSTMGS